MTCNFTRHLGFHHTNHVKSLNQGSRCNVHSNTGLIPPLLSIFLTHFYDERVCYALNSSAMASHFPSREILRAEGGIMLYT